MRAETPLFICDDPADTAAHLERLTAGPCEAANAILRLKVGVGWTPSESIRSEGYNASRLDCERGSSFSA